MSLKKQTISGVKWVSIAKIVLTILGIIKISVLARFLDSKDFGLMALVTFVLGFMNLFMDLGFTTAILHKQKITKKEYASLYWSNMLFSIFLFLLIFSISPFIASFYNEPELKLLIPLMGFSLILSATGKQFQTIAQKKLRFKYTSYVEMSSTIFGLFLGVTLAVKGYGVYALVYSALGQYLLSNGIFLIKGIKGSGIIFYFNYSKVKPFLKIGLYQVGGQVINYFNRDIDILIIGKFFGSEILGGYSLAKQLIRRPLGIINPIVNNVLIPIFPKFQNDNFKLKSYFLRLFNIMGVINGLVYGLIAIWAFWLIKILYGDNFTYIESYVQLFAIVIYLRSMATNVGLLVIAKGRTDYEFLLNIGIIIITPMSVYFGSIYSIETVILVLGVIQLFLLIPGWYFFYFKLINFNLLPYLKSHLVPFFIAITIFIIFYSFKVDYLFLKEIIFSILLIICLIIYGYFKTSEIKNFLKTFKINKQI